MSIELKEALDNKLISNSTFKFLPKRCDCGQEFEFSDSLRELKCTNPNCESYIASRIERFCLYNYIHLEYDKILVIVEKLKLVTPFQLVLLEEAYNNKLITENDIPGLSDVLHSIKNALNRKYFIYNLIEMCGILKLSKVAKKIADGFGSIDELYIEIENGQVSFINERLGIDSSDTCILSLDIYKELIKIKEELIFAEAKFSIKDYSDKIYIAFNDHTEPFLNRKELIDYLDYKFKAKFVAVSVISDTTDILVKHTSTTSSKYRTARLINDKYIADKVNSGELQLSDIGKITSTELKPIGSKVYVDTLENVIARLELVRCKK